MRIFRLGFIAILGGLWAQANAAERPNVLVIYTDDQGSADARCYGSKDVVTPAIDRLAREGVRFTRMLAPSAICSASRAGLLTGLIPMRAGVPGNVSSQSGKPGMPVNNYTMAELLRDAGYRTHHVGKWHLGYTEETMPLGQGFDTSWGHMGGCIDNYSHFFYWRGPNRHDLWRNGKEVWEDGENFGRRMVEEVQAVIDADREEPFFLYWAINWPHYPLQGFLEWRRYYEEKGLESPRDKYAAFLSSMDELIGDVLDHLTKKGLDENTIVIFQSDHGQSVEERTFGGGGNAGPYRGHKSTFFEGGLRVPSIVRWPGQVPAGEVREQFVTGCDWYPTLLEWCGAERSADLPGLDGRNIAAVIEDPGAASPHDHFFWTFGLRRDHWALTEGDWKLIGNPRDRIDPDSLQGKDKELFLVNLAEDVGETTNRAESNPEVVTRLLELREQYVAGLKEDAAALQAE